MQTRSWPSSLDNMYFSLTYSSSSISKTGVVQTSSSTAHKGMAELEEQKFTPDGTVLTKDKSQYPDESCQGKCMYYLCCRCSKRYYTAWLSSLGFMITFGIRCNMSWAMLTMQARHTAANMSHLPPEHTHHTHHESLDHSIGLVGLMNVTTVSSSYSQITRCLIFELSALFLILFTFCASPHCHNCKWWNFIFDAPY